MFTQAKIDLSFVQVGDDGWATVAWTVQPPSQSGIVQYAAAAPYMRNSSFDGSCLPYPNLETAMNGPHATQGTARLPKEEEEEEKSKEETKKKPIPTYQARFPMPNSYYVGLGTELVPPSMEVGYVAIDGTVARGRVSLAPGAAPYRTLTYPAIRTSPDFYYPPRPADQQTQADILAISGYKPKDAYTAAAAPTTPAAFWNGKPPV